MPKLQVQQKTQFRQCKDFIIADFNEFVNTSAYKSLEKVQKADQVKSALADYSVDRFPELMAALDSEEKDQFLNELFLPIFAHKRRKGFPFIKDNTEDFAIVTDVCDSFSETNMLSYFRKPTLAYLFAKFGSSTNGKNFAD